MWVEFNILGGAKVSIRADTISGVLGVGTAAPNKNRCHIYTGAGEDSFTVEHSYGDVLELLDITDSRPKLVQELTHG
jgi:hypothetical protein